MYLSSLKITNHYSLVVIASRFTLIQICWIWAETRHFYQQSNGETASFDHLAVLAEIIWLLWKFLFLNEMRLLHTIRAMYNASLYEVRSSLSLPPPKGTWSLSIPDILLDRIFGLMPIQSVRHKFLTNVIEVVVRSASLSNRLTPWSRNFV
jgi:hypothetical protein